MQLYLIGPAVFKMIFLGLVQEYYGVIYEIITSQGTENQDEQRQASAKALRNV